ncbi:MAG: CusA/CzcA family heavy metal efflux RND transporter [Myxococcaceae bacterium]|nr:CusA/CzcA family heavy metal efflux RND transporter [Myxococcaceae bacterium]
MLAFFSAVARWSLNNRPIVLLATALFVLMGIRAATQLPIDAVPDVTNVQVQVITTAPALSPVETEQYVTVPVERAMAGIPKTTEVRSISKYGLSVVTVAFQEGTDIYWARQLVNERMREAQDAVPAQYGRPDMGPISSGLGEIYQFTLRNENMTLMQLEEQLDWYIAPQLRMVPGIVEVNSFGGEDRQYQVVLDPARLQATGVSVAQVVEALKKSNANAGGGYIEHQREHFVIGTDGLVTSLDDLRNVVIGATAQGVPITIATVGDVQFGARLRRGAATKDGEGEVVVGVALMLMGENSRTVTEAVKAKLRAIEPSLPKGTRIEPFYDRAALVDRTIKTVGKNLLEGALLVVLVLLVLLGDLRAGLVVAVTIPLSMLFAIMVMNATGLSGNLMSLGAIDFGLLVDGAVIIVENVVRRLSDRQRALSRPLTKEERVRTVEDAVKEVRTASAFGEIIIAIVYLPVLALTGTEGKLFKPMATTVLLALAGAFIFSVTLIPVLSSYWVKPKNGHEETWFIRKVHALYVPLFRQAMRHQVLTLGVGVVSLSIAVGLFTRLGAEFIPQLDEGDLLIEARRLTGAALSETVRTDINLGKALKKIHEVDHVVSRIGSPELATDPMSIEASDVYVVLKPREQWQSGVSKADIAEKLESVLAASAEVGGAISQPIQMRTNELVAGIRSDVGILIYGSDLKELARLGEQVATAARKVRGAVDVRLEQTQGLKYLRIKPDRNRLARYGLTIEDVNQVTETLAVGHRVGDVLEGERRFGIVVRTQHRFAGDIEPLKALPLRSVSGQVVPLGDVAELEFVTGPAQVSREAQSRRVTVEFNVRGRDLMSVVNDAQVAVGLVPLPVGYRLEWGGQFHHYTEARQRLSIVVPLALALILFLLWLSFGSMRAGLLIFVNVPFATVGGVVALWLRDIPFSISAGVGFIALFGVAVLNGLVLVSFARHLEETGVQHVEAISRAAQLRLRPVLMTALVASLGFIPMALSAAPGAEVQRPLATVVVGGLVSATLLTLFVLPVLYARFGKGRVSAEEG